MPEENFVELREMLKTVPEDYLLSQHAGDGFPSGVGVWPKGTLRMGKKALRRTASR
jgi:hypothetical protein